MNAKHPSIRTEILVTVLGILGAILFFAFYDQAFPAAALELKLTRQEIEQAARATLKEYGYELGAYQYAQSFSTDGWASIFLQRTLGIPEANRMIRAEQIPVWYWRSRWFVPLQKEEFSLELSTDGRVVGFSHSLDEDAPGASLELAEAQQLAEQFLVEQIKLDLANWEQVTASSKQMPGGRTDHFFEWKRRDFNVGEADLRRAVLIQGDRLGSYKEWLKIPEDFTRRFSEQSNKAGFIDGIATFIGYYGFMLVAIAALGWSLLHNGRTYKTAVLMALLVAGVGLLSSLNSLPLYRMGYSTTVPYAQFWTENIFGELTSTLMVFVYFFMLWAGAERVGRLSWPRTDKIHSLHGDRWVTLARSGWRGLMLGGVMGGYVVLFYLVATRLLGGWSPMDVSYSNLYATPFPFLSPILSGLQPAVEEELLYRLVGIGLVLGLTKKRWLALLIPGLLWGFAHASYVRDPIYFRGIELTLEAIFIAGVFFLTFDLTTTIIGHMVFNSMLGALPMLRSGEPYYVFCGLVVIFFLITPILPGLWRTLRRKASGVAPPAEPELLPAVETDLEALEALPIEPADWRAWLDDPQAVIVCLKLEGKTVGAAAGRLEQDKGELLQVYVPPALRGRYWGSRLADQVSAVLAEKGAQFLNVSAPAHDRASLAFLSAQGWLGERLMFKPGPVPSFQLILNWMAERRLATLKRSKHS